MRRSIISGLVVIGSIVMNGCSSSDAVVTECFSTRQFTRMAAPAFSSFVMNVAAQGQSRVDVYLQIPYKKLRFQKEGTSYSASYSYTFVLRDVKMEIVQTKEIDRNVSVGSYEESVSLRFDSYLQTFFLTPGTYTLEIVSRDNLSQLMYRSTETVEAKDFSMPPVSASSVLLLDTISHNEKGVVLRPILPDYISVLTGSIGTFQQIYNTYEGDTVTVSLRYFQPRQRKTEEERISYLMPPYRINNVACKEKYDTMYFAEDSTFISNGKTIQFIQLYPLPNRGLTAVERAIEVRSLETKDTISTPFFLFRRDPLHKFTPTPEEIFFALRFIGRDDELDSLMADTGKVHSEKFDEFWSTHGGNQRRHDFEKRVQEANQLFTTCAEGSKTPMGIVYIICGMPDYIDCRGEYVENWYYNLGERSYAVQFRRANEHSEHVYYELLPFSISDVFWQYYIEQWRRKN